MTITPSLLEAFLKCPTKCWLRFTNEPPSGNAYAEWVQTEQESYRADAAKRLLAGAAPDGCVTSPGSSPRGEAHYSPEDLKSTKWRVVVDLVVQTQDGSADRRVRSSRSAKESCGLGGPPSGAELESHLHAVERIPSEGRGKPAQFVPIRFIYRNKLTQDDKLLLAFDALVLSQVLGREVIVGKIIHGDGHSTFKVKLGARTAESAGNKVTSKGLTGEVRKRIEKMIVLLSSPTATLTADSNVRESQSDEARRGLGGPRSGPLPPDLVLNRHCAECEFRDRCRKIAIEKDDLSLLSSMSAQERQKLRSKGIFTVTQLSYTFLPRRRQTDGDKPKRPDRIQSCMRSLRFLFLLSALGVAPFADSAENARQIASDTFPSVVLLVMEDEGGQPVSLGSGFFVKEKVIASNFHVIEKAARGYAKLVVQKAKYNITGVVGLDSKHDLVLLAVEDATAPALKLGGDSNVAVGDTVFAVGNPQGLEGTFSQGIVSGMRQFETESLLQITAPISPGSSGGPVLDLDGKVIGVAVATFKGGQNLNFAIPVKHVMELLQKLGKPEPLSSKATKTAKSILDELGGSKTRDAIVGNGFTFDRPGIVGEFSFSLVNHLRAPVRNVVCLVALFDPDGNPIDVNSIRYTGTIPAGLAKRMNGRVDPSVEKLSVGVSFEPYPRKPKGKIEFRILDFEIAE